MISTFMVHKLEQADFTPKGIQEVEKFLNKNEDSCIYQIFNKSCIIRIGNKGLLADDGFREIMSSGYHCKLTLVWEAGQSYD